MRSPFSPSSLFPSRPFILNSIFKSPLRRYYYVFGFTAIVFVIMMITCAEITMVLIYFQLCGEDYRWWWRSFLTAGSSAAYIGLYAVYYFVTKVRRCACLRDRARAPSHSFSCSSSSSSSFSFDPPSLSTSLPPFVVARRCTSPVSQARLHTLATCLSAAPLCSWSPELSGTLPAFGSPGRSTALSKSIEGRRHHRREARYQFKSPKRAPVVPIN